MCHACEHPNEARNEHCSHCGFQSEATGFEIEEFKRKKLSQSPSPTNLTIKNLLERILLSPIKTTAAIVIVVTIVLACLSWDYYGDPDFYSGILVEAHGMILDMVVVGIFILLVDNYRTTKNEIRERIELIEDLRHWRSSEAAYRIRGAILRLNKSKVTSINLESCHLKELDMQLLNLHGSKMFSCDLGASDLRKVDLSECNLKGAYLGDADCRSTNFHGATLHRTRCRRANMTAANFNGAILEKTEFLDTILSNANFHEAHLIDCKFSGANLRQANFKGAVIEDVMQFSGAIDIQFAIFSPDIATRLHQKLGIQFSPQRMK